MRTETVLWTEEQVQSENVFKTEVVFLERGTDPDRKCLEDRESLLDRGTGPDRKCLEDIESLLDRGTILDYKIVLGAEKVF